MLLTSPTDCGCRGEQESVADHWDGGITIWRGVHVSVATSHSKEVYLEKFNALGNSKNLKKQAIQKHAERHVVPFSGWDGGGSPMLQWWEPPPAPTRVLLDPTASPLPMCDGSGVGFGL
jgi:hypothetical protein